LAAAVASGAVSNSASKLHAGLLNIAASPVVALAALHSFAGSARRKHRALSKLVGPYPEGE